MKTQTIEFEKKGENGYFLEVTVNFAGDIVAATEYSNVFDAHVDCLERIQASSLWLAKIDQKFSELDWSDDDWQIQAIKELLKPNDDDLKMVGNG